MAKIKVISLWNSEDFERALNKTEEEEDCFATQVSTTYDVLRNKVVYTALVFYK